MRSLLCLVVVASMAFWGVFACSSSIIAIWGSLPQQLVPHLIAGCWRSIFRWFWLRLCRVPHRAPGLVEVDWLQWR